MADDPPFYTPGLRTPPRERQPGEPLFSFRTADHRQVDCELRADPGVGWEAQVFIDGELFRARRFATRAGAEHWAQGERQLIESGRDWDL
jgi:hypothetical protein